MEKTEQVNLLQSIGSSVWAAAMQGWQCVQIMLYAFIFPLMGGKFPFLAIGLLRKRYPEIVARNINYFGIATHTVDSIIQRVFEIYGTTNHLTGLYVLVGVILLFARIIFYLGDSS